MFWGQKKAIFGPNEHYNPFEAYKRRKAISTLHFWFYSGCNLQNRRVVSGVRITCPNINFANAVHQNLRKLGILCNDRNSVKLYFRVQYTPGGPGDSLIGGSPGQKPKWLSICT